MAEFRGESGGVGIEVRELYKLFGFNPTAHIAKVRDGLSKSELLHHHQHVIGLRNINVSVPAGSIQVIMGLSGSGKSTLIRHINRLVEPTAGEVLIDGTDVLKMGRAELQRFRRMQTAMVFQKFALLPHRTVLANTVFGLEIQGVPRAVQLDRAHRWINRVGLAGFEGRYPNQLSGGMQQRVGLARALANDAPILLMDEAYSALDPLIRMDMQTVLLDLQREIRKTVIFITHDLDEALRIGDRIAILRDGEVIQQGTSQDIVLRPADDYIAKFVREVNRGRFVRVDAIMAPGADVAGPRIANDAMLEDAMRLLARSGSRVVVVTDAHDRAVGHLTMEQLVDVMSAPDEQAVKMPQNVQKMPLFS